MYSTTERVHVAGEGWLEGHFGDYTPFGDYAPFGDHAPSRSLFSTALFLTAMFQLPYSQLPCSLC